MTRLRTILIIVLCALALPCTLQAQQLNLDIEALTGEGQVEYDLKTHLFHATKGVIIRYEGAVLTADTVTVNEQTGEVIADGAVRIERDAQIGPAITCATTSRPTVSRQRNFARARPRSLPPAGDCNWIPPTASTSRPTLS